MATIRDVAEKAGVTVTTVSRVLNNRGYISEKTRKKVYEAMKELNYQPNELARSLYRRKSYLIGLLIPSVSHPFFAELTSYIEYYAYQNDYKILLCNSLQDVEKEKDYINMLKRHQVDGIIIGSHTLKTEQYLNVNLPIVAIDRYFSEKIPYVASDNYNGGVLATKLLIQNGCRKIAHISGPLILNTPANNRYKAFMDVVKEHNIENVVVETKLNVFDTDEYKKLIIKLFTDHPDIDGVFASSDLIAATIINAAREIGKEVPKDLKIVGYDDISIAKTIVPPLTTIRQPIEEMAKKTIEIILDQIDGKEVSIENVLPITLVERESV
ncbi:transcriptional regulator, LacI family [Thermoanaerobacterium thermosaccharolyticum DSM 571]|uniref:Transcriptional regulator, LacI family n=1 Tax=Thermoanaerobacterium thermosaccharolyticum (strain ATCC 7956 / DSM 571 / NCIMB 9385 / NCA 3814 / NCTC 13789 / WDCM 00135 / 2032) TaxID=580327 RepID=D9TT06_THETC|nr:LacI family DNA-binding transcriptional regulator [Thermoanaerobacterium thermosaccharolyticum]ADL69404.1 transcriptional regulator, LacI family [Thermoanaerobacterium thermosaccharolyticum DSM 571]